MLKGQINIKSTSNIIMTKYTIPHPACPHHHITFYTFFHPPCALLMTQGRHMCLSWLGVDVEVICHNGYYKISWYLYIIFKYIKAYSYYFVLCAKILVLILICLLVCITKPDYIPGWRTDNIVQFKRRSVDPIVWYLCIYILYLPVSIYIDKLILFIINIIYKMIYNIFTPIYI